MHQSVCPSCGHKTLDTTSLQESSDMRDGTQRDLGITIMVLMFECRHCLWRGSSATLNYV